MAKFKVVFLYVKIYVAMLEKMLRNQYSQILMSIVCELLQLNKFKNKQQQPPHTSLLSYETHYLMLNFLITLYYIKLIFSFPLTINKMYKIYTELSFTNILFPQIFDGKTT